MKSYRLLKNPNSRLLCKAYPGIPLDLPGELHPVDQFLQNSPELQAADSSVYLVFPLQDWEERHLLGRGIIGFRDLEDDPDFVSLDWVQGLAFSFSLWEEGGPLPRVAELGAFMEKALAVLAQKNILASSLAPLWRMRLRMGERAGGVCTFQGEMSFFLKNHAPLFPGTFH